MTNNQTRDYSCKDEELPVICNYTAFSLNRDLPEFTTYSPRFTQEYVDSFESRIKAVTELIEPKSETVELKIITDRLYTTLDSLISPANYLTGCIEMAQESLKISPADFGLKALRKSIYARDAENVIKSLHTINTNIRKHQAILTEQGLSEDLTAKFITAYASIATDKQIQYKIISNRKNIVQKNLGMLNALYAQFTEILRIGKILYKATDAAKLKEYTLNEQKKRVRRTFNPENGNTAKINKSEKAEDTGVK